MPAVTFHASDNIAFANSFASFSVGKTFVCLEEDVRFSNRPVGVKHFQTIHRCGVDVTHGLALLYGIGTRALPSWDPRTGRNNL